MGVYEMRNRVFDSMVGQQNDRFQERVGSFIHESLVIASQPPLANH